MIKHAKDLSLDRNERINQILEIAESVYSDLPVLAVVSTCQAILESALLNRISTLARQQNNLFGIKGKGGQYVTEEVINGQTIRIRDGFAAYSTLEESFRGHRALMEKPRYKAVLNAEDASTAFIELYKAGYATDEQYSEKLQRIKEDYL